MMIWGLSVVQSNRGRIHLAVDGWTSPNVISFLGVVVCMATDGRIHTYILDFINYVSRHIQLNVF
jgi:hypothetical protein